jgi:tripartite-type tricarboxylate transporter receptor subunit TctC
MEVDPMLSLARKSASTFLAAAVFLFGEAAPAQTYPSKPIRWIIPYPAGGGSDFFGRTVTTRLAEQLGQTIVIDNRPGAATMIGAQEAAKAPPDGYTVLQGDSPTFAVNPSVYKTMPYDPQKDFAPVTLTARFAMLLVVNPTALKVNSVKEFIDIAKKEPGKLSFASVGIGTTHHLAMELFKQQAGIELVHVPYKGAAPAVQDLLAGHVPSMFLDMATAVPHLKSGRIKALGVAASQRIANLADVPTIREAGLSGVEVWAWQGVAVPAGTPKQVIAKLNAEYEKAIRDPAVRQKLIDAGIEPMHSTPEEMASHIKGETAKWAKVVKEARITAQ